MNRRRGFSLIELIVVIAALGGATLAVALPAMNAARGIETGTTTTQLALALEEESARAATDMRALPVGAGWSGALLPLVAASPYVPHAATMIDGITRSYRRSVACVDETLTAVDPTCVAGYALVTVTVDRSDGTTASASFLATPEGP